QELQARGGAALAGGAGTRPRLSERRRSGASSAGFARATGFWARPPRVTGGGCRGERRRSPRRGLRSGEMPSEETRRVLKLVGVAGTNLGDASDRKAPPGGARRRAP